MRNDAAARINFRAPVFFGATYPFPVLAFAPEPPFSCAPAGAKLVMMRSARTVTKIMVDSAYMDGLMPRRTSL